MEAVGPTASRRRIFLVDDHELLRMGMAMVIREQPGWEVCGQAGEGPLALDGIRDSRPDLVILDLRLEDGDGLQLIGQVRAIAPSVRILVFSMLEEDLYAERCLRAGAHGFLCKQASLQSLLSAIQQVAQGRVYLSPRMTDRIVSRRAGAAMTDRSPLERLSDREMEVFERLGKGLSAKEIAHELHLSVKTVEYHRQHIKEKLQLSNSSAVVRMATAYSLGEIHSPEQASVN